MGSKSRRKKGAREAKEQRELIEVDFKKKGVKKYLFGDCDILVGIERIDPDNPVWHVNISTKGRCLTCDEVTYIRFLVVPPDKSMVLFLQKNHDPCEVDLFEVKFKK